VTRRAFAVDFTGRRIGYVAAVCTMAGSAAVWIKADMTSLGTTAGEAAKPTVRSRAKLRKPAAQEIRRNAQ